MMTSKKSRLVIMVGAIVLLALVCVAGPAGAAVQAAAEGRHVDLPAEMLETSDLPPGFQPYEPMTGPLNAQRAAQLGGALFAQAADLLHGWIRYWVSGLTGQQVIELAVDAGNHGNASEASASFASSVSARGATRQQLTDHLDGYSVPLRVDGTPYIMISTPLARGPFFFVLYVLAPVRSSSADASLLANLASAQERKVPANTPDTGTSLSDLEQDPYNAAGFALGALLAYLAIVSGIAFLRDPLRRGRRRERSPDRPVQPDGQHVLDVSGRARQYRKTARLRLAVQLAGLSLMACGADPYLVPKWYLFLLAGAAATWAGGRFIRPAGLGLARNRGVLSGARRVRVTALMSLALVLVVAGALVLIGAGLNQSEPAVVQAVNATASGSAGPGQNDAYLWIGVILMGTGAVLARRARRLAAVDAYRLMQRDTRPPVLYLRSFGDDALKLCAATFGRPSLLERFTPRRFDAFEEVIARHFSATGPVIALNPPDTKLAPLGAARETLDSADWQATIIEWMSRSAVIVFVMPPGKVTGGLTWELQQVSANQYWTKTLIIVPPIRASLLQARWQGFLAACARIWPFTFPLPTEVSKPLALTFGNDVWTAIRADRQDEWAYGAAIKEAFGRLPLPTATALGQPDLRGAHRSGAVS
jgi:hypothetical protein